MTTRRELLASLSTIWLARAAVAAEAVKPDAVTAALRRFDELSRALQDGSISQVDWQRGVDEAAHGIDLAAFCRRVDFGALVKRLPLLHRGTSAEHLDLLPHQAFTPKIFALGPGRAIIPHGHDNMVSHQLVLSGEVHGWHWERLRDEPDTLLLRPTIDRVFKPGDSSSISDHRDNVHWFVATSGPAYTLDCIVDNLDPARDHRFRIDFVDPQRAAPAGNGEVRMPRIDLDEALGRYG